MTSNQEKALKTIREFGYNPSSFFGLYPQFKLFISANIPGGIFYADTPTTWVGACEPMCPRENQTALFREFSSAAKTNGKRATILPCHREFAARAYAEGLGVLRIGSEPIYNIYVQKPELTTAARSLKYQADRYKDFKIEVKKQSEITVPLRQKLEAISTEWLSSRKSEPLGFLNEVAPFMHSEHKLYFIASYENDPVAFIAAIPNWTTNAWYLVDILRKNSTPAAVTELLIYEAMQTLSQQGAKLVSLGTAPLSNLEHAPNDPIADHSKQKRLYNALSWTFKNATAFYHFKSLYEFKMKFKPTTIEPVYLVYEGDRISPKITLGVLRAFLPKGLLRTAIQTALRALRQFSGYQFWHSKMESDWVPLPAPERTWRSKVVRLSGTVTIAMTITLAYFFDWPAKDDATFYIANSWSHMQWRAGILSGFAHNSLGHLALNLGLLAFFGGGLEILFGTRRLALIYALGHLTTNTMTAMVLFLFHVAPVGATDRGASLAVFSVAAALLTTLRHGYIWIALGTVGAVAHAVLTHDLINLNHAIALALGIVFAKLVL